MLDLMYRVPSDDSISKCVVDKKMVENNLALDGEEILGIEQDPKKEVKERTCFIKRPDASGNIGADTSGR